jgi:hypothetical protein
MAAEGVWHRIPAEQGYGEVRLELGVIFARGHGEIAEWYRKADERREDLKASLTKYWRELEDKSQFGWKHLRSLRNRDQ